MVAAKKKPRIQASDVAVGNRTLEGVLIDLAEQEKANSARIAQCAERSARAEELATVALQTIAAVTQDLRALAQDLRALAQRHDDRLAAIENAIAAE